MPWKPTFQFDSPTLGSCAGSLAGPSEVASANVLLFVHEDSLSCNSLFYPFLEERLVKSGFAVAWLARRHRDEIEPTRELEVIRTFMERVAHGLLNDRISRGHMGLIGHGLGGGIALLAAARSIEITSSGAGVVPGVVTLAGCATLDRGSASPRPEFANDVRKNPGAMNLETAIQGYPGRVVFVHGEEDAVIPIDEGERLYHWSNKATSRFVMMEKVGHSYGAEQPMLIMTKEVDRIGKILVDFFHGLLG